MAGAQEFSSAIAPCVIATGPLRCRCRDNHSPGEKMTRQLFRTLVFSAFLVGSGCTISEPLSPLTVDQPTFQQAPATGNGQKEIIPVDVELPGLIACANGVALDVHVVGWIQIHATSPAARSVNVFHLVFTFSNEAGKTYVFQNVNSDHYYLDENGNLIDAVSGRNGVSGETHSGVIGRLVINVETGEVLFVAGQNVDAGNRACAALG
jgi:hypothetical protein